MGLELEVLRFWTKPDATFGMLFKLMPRGVPAPAGREFLTFTLEDEKRAVKVPGETRIPAGRYQIKLRRSGGMHIHYAARFRELHKGMLWLQDVPNFEYVYIHVGNTTGDTQGCILVGDTALPRVDQVGSSEVAYRRIYPMIADVITSGGDVWLTVSDVA